MSGCDCGSIPQQNLISVEAALKTLLASCNVTTKTERVALKNANGRILAKTVQSTINVPAWDNSAMDGFAINTHHYKQGEPLPVSQRIPAGYNGTNLEKGTAARIFTGAPVPPDANAVVMQELCDYDEANKVVIVNTDVAFESNIRKSGEDIQEGTEVIAVGTKLLPQHLGVIASVGIAEVDVFKKIKVAILATGDEITEPGKPLLPGKIYNSNKYTFWGLLENLGVEIIDLGDVEDTFDATCNAMEHAADIADIVLASGGVSVGEEDHVKTAIEKLGKLTMWKMNIRPGKPLAFGIVKDTPFIGVPGNPVSLFVTFSIFARPFIQKTTGQTDVEHKPLKIKSAFDWSKPDKRREFIRTKRVLNDQGQWVIEAFNSRSSGVLTSLTWSDGIAIIPENTTIKKGENIDFLPFEGIV